MTFKKAAFYPAVTVYLLQLIMPLNTVCSVPGCTNIGKHQFPYSRPKLMKIWLTNIKRDGKKKGEKFIPKRNSTYICRSHFNESDYKTHGNDGKIFLMLHVLVVFATRLAPIVASPLLPPNIFF